MGNHAAALPLYQQALKASRTAVGENHPDYAASLSNLAGLHQAMGDHAAALPLHRQALEIRRIALGENHPLYAASLNNQAELFEHMGDKTTARPLRRQALEITRNASREDQPQSTVGAQNVAVIYHEREDDVLPPPSHPAPEVHPNTLGEHLPIYSSSLDFSPYRPPNAQSTGPATGTLCVRTGGSGPRLFPPIGQNLFAVDEGETGRSPGEVVVRQLLSLANRPMTRCQRVHGRGLDSSGLFGRVLWLFRQGMDSEFSGRWGLADFYWRESR